jgi:glutathione S-transferase
MSHDAVTVVGSYLSPYIRKVLVCLSLKSIDYVIEPIAPVLGNDEFSRTRAPHRSPIFIDENVSLADSTVICEYLEERYPEPALYPATPQARARARWLEEYADTRMGEVFIWRLFNERVIKQSVLGEPGDPAVASRAVEVQAPQVLDYLEREFASARPFLFGAMGIADITVASFMRNAFLAGFTIDPVRWPAMHACVENALRHPAFVALQRFETVSLATPLAGQRDALQGAGAPIASEARTSVTPQRSALLN